MPGRKSTNFFIPPTGAANRIERRGRDRSVPVPALSMIVTYGTWNPELPGSTVIVAIPPFTTVAVADAVPVPYTSVIVTTGLTYPVPGLTTVTVLEWVGRQRAVGPVPERTEVVRDPSGLTLGRCEGQHCRRGGFRQLGLDRGGLDRISSHARLQAQGGCALRRRPLRSAFW